MTFDDFKVKLIEKHPWLGERAGDQTVKLRARDFWKVLEKSYDAGKSAPIEFERILREIMR